MASAKGILVNALGRLVLRDATICSVHELTDHVRVIGLEAYWAVGKVGLD